MATSSKKEDVVLEKPTYEVVGECMYEYGMYVNQDRAIPSVQDGLKPSQRRILWAMYSIGALPNKTTVKSARVVGDTIGNYHPHGDTSTYEALVHLTHLRYPLVKGDGNFGSPSVLQEKSPAAYRYTECKLSPLGSSCFDQIHVADKTQNYDDTKEEPEWIPTPLPLALINGFSGVGVALKTRVPPHNDAEVIAALLHLLDEPKASTEDLLQFIKGPDYGTGVLLSKKSDLLDLYENGRGRLQFRSSYSVEEAGKNKQKLIISGLAPEVKKKKFFAAAAELAKKKLIETPVTDESTLDKKRGTFHYKDTIVYRDAQIIRDRLLPMLDTHVDYNWMLLDADGRPRRFSLLEMLHSFLDFRREVETRVLQDRLEKLTRRLGIVVARYRASRKLKEVSAILQSAVTEEEAKSELLELLSLKYDWQADAILESQIRSLMRLRSDDLKAQGQKLKTEIKDVKADLDNIDSVIRKSLQRLAEKTDQRGMKLRGTTKDFGTEQDYWVGVTPDGKVDVSLDLPLKSKAAWNYVDFFSAKGEIAIIHDTNRASIVHVSYLDKYDPQGRVVGATSKSHCLVVTSAGRYVAFPAEQRRKSFVVVKDLSEAEIVAVVGFDPDEGQIVVANEENDLIYYTPSDLKITRPNTKSKPLPGLRQDVLAAWYMPPDLRLVDKNGDELGEPEVYDHYYHLSNKNLVSLQTGTRKVCTYGETMKLVAESSAKVVVPIV